jgi:hypothetical protein
MSVQRSGFRFLVACTAALAVACSSTPDEDESPPAVPAADAAAAPAKPTLTPEQLEEAAHKVADLNNQLELSRRKLERAQLDEGQQKADGEAALQKASVERELAKKALAHFEAVEMPQRLAKAELDLKDAFDYMTENQEEMQQLEQMYEKDDLADKTKEIVLARGKRRLDRAKQRHALAQKDFDDLKSTQLPEQREKLKQTLRDEEVEYARAEFNAKTGLMDKETAVLAAVQEMDKLTRELEKAKKSLAGGPAGDDATDAPRSDVASAWLGQR